MLEKDGIASREQVLSVFPEVERMERGRVAVIECYCRIPCNPCEFSCPRKAITIGENINDRPKIDTELCNGCGNCVSHCPGLAIMLVQLKGDEATFTVPYEFLPLPKENEVVDVLSRGGQTLCLGRVVRVVNPPSYDRTPEVSFTAPKAYLYEARNFRRRCGEGMNELDDTIICRCSDVTLGQIRKLIAEGYTDFDSIKRITRAGMGPCQGKTCGLLILRELSIATGKPMSELKPQTSRPPVGGVTLKSIAEGVEER